MKTLTPLVLALLLTGGGFLTAAPGPTAPARTQSAYAFVVRDADFAGWTIRRGMSMKRLTNTCGQPDRKITDTIWIYDAFHAVPDQKNAPACTHLMVMFADGVVSDLHLVNEPTIVAVATHPQAVSQALLAATP